MERELCCGMARKAKEGGGGHPDARRRAQREPKEQEADDDRRGERDDAGMSCAWFTVITSSCRRAS